MFEIKLEKHDITLLMDKEEYEIAKNYKWVTHKFKRCNSRIYTSIKKCKVFFTNKVFNIPDGKMIYHKNGNLYDFRKSEIAFVSKQEYFHLSNPQRNLESSSKYFGVFKTSEVHPWQTKIEKNGVFFGGRYDTEYEAAIVFDYMAIDLYENSSNRNFPAMSVDELIKKYKEIELKYGKNSRERISRTTQGVPSSCNEKTSKYVGVHLNKRKNKWEAEIRYMKKRYWLGLFHNEIKAAQAYDKKALELYGENANFNFPN